MKNVVKITENDLDNKNNNITIKVIRLFRDFMNIRKGWLYYTGNFDNNYVRNSEFKDLNRKLWIDLLNDRDFNNHLNLTEIYYKILNFINNYDINGFIEWGDGLKDFVWVCKETGIELIIKRNNWITLFNLYWNLNESKDKLFEWDLLPDNEEGGVIFNIGVIGVLNNDKIILLKENVLSGYIHNSNVIGVHNVLRKINNKRDNDRLEIHHIDSNRYNNRISNLDLVDRVKNNGCKFGIKRDLKDLDCNLWFLDMKGNLIKEEIMVFSDLKDKFYNSIWNEINDKLIKNNRDFKKADWNGILSDNKKEEYRKVLNKVIEIEGHPIDKKVKFLADKYVYKRNYCHLIVNNIKCHLVIWNAKYDTEFNNFCMNLRNSNKI